MATSTNHILQKKRGRPATGQDPVTAIRLAEDLRQRVDAWAKQQPDEPARSEAIRRLVERGLSVFAPARPRNPKRRAKAAAIAGDVIDRHADQSASLEEQEGRKRRLLHGPKEFRRLRRDHPTPKPKA